MSSASHLDDKKNIYISSENIATKLEEHKDDKKYISMITYIFAALCVKII